MYLNDELKSYLYFLICDFNSTFSLSLLFALLSYKDTCFLTFLHVLILNNIMQGWDKIMETLTGYHL